MQKENGQIIETAIEARGGFLGRPVAVVLGISLAFVVVVFVLAYVGVVKF